MNNATQTQENETMTTKCCVCNKIKTGEEWKLGGLYPETVKVSHGLCQPCYEVVKADARNWLVNNGYEEK